MNAKQTTRGHAVRCARVHLDGRVQGVGFRQTTCLVARGYRIVGYVKNLQDGSVELMAQGEQIEVLNFLDALRAQAIFRFVRQEDLNWLETTQEFDRFEIRYG
ncbi:MAG: acylphosphatase [Kiritimatiellae bacterium]|nr:acylphosphatase [Kiritimatiellia bacterium]